jgi:hypothetical protein
MAYLVSASGVAGSEDAPGNPLARPSATISAMKNSTLAAATMLLLPLLASADESFRCGKWIASSGMSVSELTQKCGEPTRRESTTQDVMARNRNTGLMVKTGETQTETWTYDRGAHAAAMVVTIVDGRIKKLERQK